MAIDITTTAHGPTTPAGTGELVAATTTTHRNERWFEVALLGGLAGVFIVNALVAWLQPSDFVDLVKRSMLSDLAPFDIGRWLAWAIGLNDLVLGVRLCQGDPPPKHPANGAGMVGRLAARRDGGEGDVARCLRVLTIAVPAASPRRLVDAGCALVGHRPAGGLLPWWAAAAR